MATINAHMQQRRDTAANWTSANPTLLAGELGYETDTGKVKLGDGSTAWASLAYAAPALNHASQHETGGSDPIDALTFSNTGLKILDTIGDHELIIACGDDLNADRTLSIVMNDADRQVSLGGNFTIAGATTVTAAAATVLDDASVSAMVNTLGGASSTGTGGLVRETSPTLVTPILGTPTSGTLTNCTGLPTAGLVDDAVTNAKLADMAANTVKSNNTSASATPGDNTLIDLLLAQSRFYPVIVQDFHRVESGQYPPYAGTAIASGTVGAASGTNDANHPGQLRIIASTSANSGYRVHSQVDAYRLKGGEFFEIAFYCHLLTNTTAYLGFLDTTSSSDAVDGMYVSIVGTTLTGKTANNSSRTNTGTTYALSISTWYRLRISCDSGATTVTYTLFNDAGTPLWTDTCASNLPSGRDFGAGAVVTNNGLAAVDVMTIDRMDFGWTSPLTR